MAPTAPAAPVSQGRYADMLARDGPPPRMPATPPEGVREMREQDVREPATFRGIPRIVWMYWEQGWDAAPELVQRCRRSWEHYNPDWDVRCLDGETVRRFFDLEDWMPGSAGRPGWCWSAARRLYNAYHDSPAYRVKPRLMNRMIKKKRINVQGRSDIIRLGLLDRYGGVWADATLWCHRPLNDWLPPYVRDGYFSFQNGQDRSQEGELLMWTSWFLAARRRHLVVHRLLDAARSYWTRRSRWDQYMWLFVLFNRLYESDDQLRACWDAVPRYDAPRSAPGPRYFAPFTDARLSGVSDSYRALIASQESPVFKLRQGRKDPLEQYDRIQYLFATIPDTVSR